MEISLSISKSRPFKTLGWFLRPFKDLIFYTLKRRPFKTYKICEGTLQAVHGPGYCDVWNLQSVSMCNPSLFASFSFYNHASAVNYFSPFPIPISRVRFYSLPVSIITIYFDALQVVSSLLDDVRWSTCA